MNARRRALTNPALVPLLAAGLGASPGVAQEYRTYDGTGNNLTHPAWGSSNTPLVRLLSTDYGDGFGSLSGASRRGGREISNLVCAQAEPTFSRRVMTNMVMQWGQWMDHDLDFRKRHIPTQFVNIPVPMGDPFFDPTGTGTAQILFNRSRIVPGTGTGPGNPRQQINVLSSFIDCNTVYGSNPIRAGLLRSFVDGKMLVSAGDLLPWNYPEEEMDFPPQGMALSSLFLAGDDRANEQTGLAAMHTLWVREHNRLCDELRAAHPGWDDQKLYQEARDIVITLNQVITYREFLPALLGPGAIAPYGGYRPKVNPGVANEFAHAAFRFAHSILNPFLARLNEDGTPIPQGPLALRDAFFQPQRLVQEGGIDPIFRGLIAQPMQELDHMLVDDVRNFLFGPPSPIGLDLAALNIQRGRDHGLPSYARARQELGLPPVNSFSDIASSPETVARLAAAYDTAADVDLWVGCVSEDHVPDASVGMVTRAILVDTFTRVRDGDRFFYLNDRYPPAQVAAFEATRLADVIRRNTGVERVQGNVFFVWPDFNHDSALNINDFVAFQTSFALGHPDADFDANGTLNINDYILFQTAFARY